MFIFEKAPFKSCHASTLVEHEPGKLLAAWFGGDDEGAKNVQIWASQFDGKAWSEPAVIGSEPGQPGWNPGLVKTAKGTIILWYKAGPSPGRGVRGGNRGQRCGTRVLLKPAKGTIILWYRAGPSPERWTGYVRTSADGKAWSAAAMMPAGQWGPVRAKPIQLASGVILAG